MAESGGVLILTEAAAARIKALLAGRPGPSAVLRLGVDTLGCAGLTYSLDFAQAKDPGDLVVEEGGATVYIDVRAAATIAGSKMDYVEGRLDSGFVFDNPNETGRCGCGVSFRVEAQETSEERVTR